MGIEEEEIVIQGLITSARSISENDVDRFWTGKGCDVLEIEGGLQYYGVTRILVTDVGGLPYCQSVEYKIDNRASETGNLFIETQTRDKAGDIYPGWLRCAVAQLTAFYLPNTQRLYTVDTCQLRRWLFTNGYTLPCSQWLERRDGSFGRGTLFPLELGKKVLGTWTVIDMDRGEVCR